MNVLHVLLDFEHTFICLFFSTFINAVMIALGCPVIKFGSVRDINLLMTGTDTRNILFILSLHFHVSRFVFIQLLQGGLLRRLSLQ
jgi:hypothetical protein